MDDAAIVRRLSFGAALHEKNHSNFPLESYVKKNSDLGALDLNFVPADESASQVTQNKENAQRMEFTELKAVYIELEAKQAFTEAILLNKLDLDEESQLDLKSLNALEEAIVSGQQSSFEKGEALLHSVVTLCADYDALKEETQEFSREIDETREGIAMAAALAKESSSDDRSGINLQPKTIAEAERGIAKQEANMRDLDEELARLRRQADTMRAVLEPLRSNVASLRGDLSALPNIQESNYERGVRERAAEAEAWYATVVPLLIQLGGVSECPSFHSATSVGLQVETELRSRPSPSSSSQDSQAESSTATHYVVVELYPGTARIRTVLVSPSDIPVDDLVEGAVSDNDVRRLIRELQERVRAKNARLSALEDLQKKFKAMVASPYGFVTIPVPGTGNLVVDLGMSYPLSTSRPFVMSFVTLSGSDNYMLRNQLNMAQLKTVDEIMEFVSKAKGSASNIMA